MILSFLKTSFLPNLRVKSVEMTLILLFLLWTPLLVVTTLKVQHSCQPMIKVNHLPTNCYQKTDLIDKKHNEKIVPPPVKPDPNPKKSLIDSVKEHPELFAGTVAIITGVGLAIASAPVLVIAGIGLSTYFITQNILDKLN